MLEKIKNIFNKKPSTAMAYHSVIVKQNNKKLLFEGQILKIEEDYNNRTDSLNYYFYDLEGNKISAKIPVAEASYCESYNYGIVKSINSDKIEVLIICKNVYVKKYKIVLDQEFDNGNAFVVNNGNLIENGNIVGHITDNRYSDNKIILCYLENDKLVSVIE